MRWTCLLLLPLLLSPTLIAGLQPYRYRDLSSSIHQAGEDNDAPPADGGREDETEDDPGHDDVQELYLTQKLDHFDSTSAATYQQRYFASYRYHSHSTGRVVAFLCVGGEGPGFDRSVLVDSVHCSGDMLELAKTLAGKFGVNVHLYALEHRYYGASYPKFAGGNATSSSPVTTEHLRYLSSRQALEDLAHFVHVINSEAAAGDGDVQWVTFGGSYPGFLAAMARFKYPHLIYAAVSSSAPLQLEVDFPGYKERQGYDLAYEKVGGSAECLRIVRTGHEQAVSLLETIPDSTTNSTINGPVELAKKFNLCHPETALSARRNQELLLGDGLIDIPAQNNDPSCTGSDMCNIGGLCEFVTKEYQRLIRVQQELRSRNDGWAGDLPAYVELEVLAKVALKQAGAAADARSLKATATVEKQPALSDGGDCLTVDFQAVLESCSSTDVEAFGWRSWLWQTCTEVGFYQTCTSDRCPFAQHYHQVDMDLEICHHAYNISTREVYDNVQATLDHYGGLDIVNTDAATRILSINGDVDPWSVLGLQEGESTKYSLPIKMVAGASHHFWTHAVKDTDAPEIVQIREYLYSVVMDWLGIQREKDSHKDESSSQERNSPSTNFALRGMKGPFEMILY